jgi:hypothetical protein
VESLIAGNDMLCLPGDVSLVMEKTFNAIKEKNQMEGPQCPREKSADGQIPAGSATRRLIDTTCLIEDLNSDVPELYRTIAKQSITLVRRNDRPYPGTLATGCLYWLRTHE